MLASILNTLEREPADPVRLPLLTSQRPLLILLGSYLLFIKVIGPKIMENRKPFDLRGAIRIYNLTQIVYNLLMFSFAVYFMLGPANYNFKCIQNLPLEHAYKDWERWLCYSYFLNKILDLLETIFFVLRKKYRQISFLHVFHHVYMIYFSYLYLWYYGYGGHGFFMCFFNVIVHIVMYTYYYQAAKDAKANLWWKKYITVVQLVQFGIIMCHSLYTLMQPDCPSAQFSAKASGSVSIFFFLLFSNFYINAYILPNKKANKKVQ
ncbi:uncharacterized protein Dana_GF17148 [Drosophila ananassae]|uniref:Elongation of very long chain fatty acids protein n=1 Tax=Drosophila ananassae TaxID=7217 RepID=B3M1D4_DROAN|nr:elongation of very long chain fatty acids protein F isoform X1 [Drosophila ananassae]EDV42161.1 uncharacterized protein Dana_GF17148 [Drosophila ananassae]